MAENENGVPWGELESLASVIDLCRAKGVTRLTWAGLSIELSRYEPAAPRQHQSVTALERGLMEFASAENTSADKHWRSKDDDVRFRHSRIKPVNIAAKKRGVGVGE